MNKSLYTISLALVVSLHGSIFDCKSFESKQEVKNIRNRKLYLLVEIGLRGGVSGVDGPKSLKCIDERDMVWVDANDIYEFSTT